MPHVTPAGDRLRDDDTTPDACIGRADENDLVRFAVQWAPFGGGDEYILPAFGLLPEQFYRRVHRAVQSGHTDRDDFLQGFCKRKLNALAQGAGSQFKGIARTR